MTRNDRVTDRTPRTGSRAKDTSLRESDPSDLPRVSANCFKRLAFLVGFRVYSLLRIRDKENRPSLTDGLFFGIEIPSTGFGFVPLQMEGGRERGREV